jgi:hypothetical protein
LVHQFGQPDRLAKPCRFGDGLLCADDLFDVIDLAAERLQLTHGSGAFLSEVPRELAEILGNLFPFFITLEIAAQVSRMVVQHCDDAFQIADRACS